MTASHKKRTNVTLDADNLAAARDLGLNVSAISDAALDQAVRQARAQSWQDTNAEALRERRDWLRDTGMPLADIQVLKAD